MGFFEGLFVKIVLGLIEKLWGLVANKAMKSKLHHSDQKAFRKQAKQVENSAELVKKSLQVYKRVTKDQANALKEHNAKFRHGGLFK